MSRGIKVFIGIAVTLLIPLSLFFLMNKKKNENVLMPPYYKPIGMAQYINRGKTYMDTLYYQLPDLKLVNQLADTVYLNNSLRGKILIVHFIFTRCGTICPNITSNISVMQKSFKKKIPEAFQFITITVDPEYDSVSVMRDYANRFTYDHDKWWFLTGDKTAIYHYMKNELGLLLDSDDPMNINHSNQVVLIDADRHIRGYYDGLNPASLLDCADDAIFLTMERKKILKQ